jgi:hypothetical protein
MPSTMSLVLTKRDSARVSLATLLIPEVALPKKSEFCCVIICKHPAVALGALALARPSCHLQSLTNNIPSPAPANPTDRIM